MFLENATDFLRDLQILEPGATATWELDDGVLHISVVGSKDPETVVNFSRAYGHRAMPDGHAINIEIKLPDVTEESVQMAMSALGVKEGIQSTITDMRCGPTMGPNDQ